MAGETLTTTPPPPTNENNDLPPLTTENNDLPPLTTEKNDLPPSITENNDLPPPPANFEFHALPETDPLPLRSPEVTESEEQEELLPPPLTPPLESAEPERKQIPRSLISCIEESNLVADLSDSEREALQELKQLVQDALNTHQFTSPKVEKSPAPAQAVAKAPKTTDAAETVWESEPQPAHEPKIEEKSSKEAEELAKEEVSIWGVPLLKDDRSDVILLKFLRAWDFMVKDALLMLRNTIRWRKEFGIDALVDEDLGDDLGKVVFMHGYDREGHPVCYNVFGEFQNKDLYQKTFPDHEKRTKFLRWRVQFLERSIRKLDFSPGGVSTIFQINDLKNSPGTEKKELHVATRQALQLLQDNYPEFVAKQVFINVPWWFLAFHTMISPFLTQRTKSKFVFSKPAKSAETLLKYISPEHVPIQYGGLSVVYCECDPKFTIADPVTAVTVKPVTKHTVELIISEKCTILWELRVVGWEVSYGVEFVPDVEGGYTIIIQKAIKLSANDEPVVHNSFKVAELGKILLRVDNPTSKKKRFLYRFKVEPF